MDVLQVLPTGKSRAVKRRTRRTSAGVSHGSRDKSSEATPVTSGAAMLAVPCGPPREDPEIRWSDAISSSGSLFAYTSTAVEPAVVFSTL